MFLSCVAFFDASNLTVDSSSTGSSSNSAFLGGEEDDRLCAPSILPHRSRFVSAIWALIRYRAFLKKKKIKGNCA